MHYPLLFLGNRQRIKSGPHLLGNTHQIVHHDLVKEPQTTAELFSFEEVGVEQHQSILYVVKTFFYKDKLKNGKDVCLCGYHGFLSDGGFYDPRYGFQTSCSCQLSLSIVILLIGLFCVFSKQFEEEFGEVLDEIHRKGSDLTGEVLNNAFEGVDNILEVVVVQEL